MQHKLLEDIISATKGKGGKQTIYGHKGDIVEITAMFGQVAIVKDKNNNKFPVNQNQLLLQCNKSQSTKPA